jgi:hypothetical protein
VRYEQAEHSRFKAAPEKFERPPVIQSSLYLPEAVYEALRKIAFDERVKIHDLVVEGLDGVLKRRGYPSVESLKTRTAKLSKKFHSSEIRQ